MKIKPLYDNIVVELKEQNETTKSGFFLPSSSDPAPPRLCGKIRYRKSIGGRMRSRRENAR